MPSSDYTPTVADVALFLRTRTRDTNGVELGTFTTATRPTAAEVSAIIADTVVNMEDDLGVDIDPRLWSSAKRVTALRAAMAIEVSYFSEQVAAGRSVYPQLNEWYKEDLDQLNSAVVETAEGGDPGADAGEDTPVWDGGDYPFIPGLDSSPSRVDLSRGSTWPEALGAFHSQVEQPEAQSAAALGSRDDLASSTPNTGTISGYLRKIRDLLSGTLNVNVVSGGGSSSGLTDAQLRAAAVPVIGPVTDTQLRATPIPVSSSGLTDAQLRAARVPVDPGSGPFPVSASALPLPSGAATEATLGSLLTTSGSPGDAAWVSGNGTVISLLKKIATSGGSAVSISDGSDVAQGAKADAAWVSGDGTVISLLKKIASSGAASGLTDAQLRASAVPVADSAGNALLTTINAILNNALGWSAAYTQHTADLGQVIFGVRKDTPAALSTDGFYHPFELDASGRVYVNVDRSALPSGASTETTVASILTGVGAPGDAAATTTGSLIAQARRIANLLAGTLTVSGTVAVSGSVAVTGPLTDTQLRATAVPVSQTSQPLPTGAATETTLAAANTAVGTTADAASTTTGTVIAHLRKIRDLLSGTLAVSGTFWQATQPVSLASQPLPTGASTEATLASVLSGVGATGDAAATTTGSVIAQLRRVANLLAGTLTVSGTVAISGSVAVTGTFWQATQPVSGTFWQATQPISAASLPLPTGAALDATLTGGTQQAINRGGAKGATTAATVTSTASGADHQGLDAVLYDASGNRLGTSGTPLRTDPTGGTTQPVSATSLPLPAGAATETTLAAANTAVGTTADAASTTTGTVIAHLRKIRDLLAGTLTVSVSGSVAVTGTFWQATQPVSGTFWQATQPVSAASLPLPTGAATETTHASILTGIGAPADAAATTTGSVIAQLRRIANLLAGTLTTAISGSVAVTGTFWQATQPVSLAATVTVDSELTTADLDTGAGTDTRAVVGLVLAKSGGAVNVSSTDPIPVSGTFWQATQPVSAASLPLPTGASTETTLASLLTTAGATGDAAGTGAVSMNAHLRSIATALAGTLTVTGGGGGIQYAEDAAHVSGDTGTMALGVRKDVAVALAGTDGDYQPDIYDASGRLWVNGSGVTQPVSGTFWQATQPISAASLPLPTGASTETTLASMNTAMGRTKVTTDGSTKDWQHVIESYLVGTTPTAVAAATPLPVVQTGTPGLPTGASTETTVASILTSLGASADAASSTTGSLNAHLRSIAAALAGTLTVGTHAVTGSGNFATTSAAASQADGHSATLGSTTDAAATTTGSVIAQLRRIANLLAGTLTISGAVTNAGTFAVQDSDKLVDNAAFTDGTTKLMPAGYIFDDVAGTALTENDIAAPRIDSKRASVMILESSSVRGRQAQVAASSTAAGATDPGLVVALSPNSPAKIFDGTNTMAVKAASTAAVAADPAAVVALSPNQNTMPNALYIKPRQVATYAAAFRLIDATAGQNQLAFTFVANTDKQLATIHHLVGSTKTVKIQKVNIVLASHGIGIYAFELRRLGAATAPATGNPAVTPGLFDTSDGAAEAVCLALPTTAGTDAFADRPLSHNFVYSGTTTAATANEELAAREIVLYDVRQQSGYPKPITMRSGVAEGLAIVGRCSTAVALNFTCYIEFTEE